MSKLSTDQRKHLVMETNFLLYTLQCVSCRIRKRNIVCLPCGHLSLCKSCAQVMLTCGKKYCSYKTTRHIEVFM